MVHLLRTMRTKEENQNLLEKIQINFFGEITESQMAITGKIITV